MFDIIKTDLIAAGAEKGTLKYFLQYWFTHPEFKIVCFFRIFYSFYNSKNIFLKIIAKMLWLRTVKISSCYISPKAKIDYGLKFPHATGIVIGDDVVIGKNVTIYQNVTIGRKEATIDGYPIIKDNVTIYAGACIVGKVTIGNNAVIGANSVVIKDVLDNEIHAGIPAKAIKSYNAN